MDRRSFLKVAFAAPATLFLPSNVEAEQQTYIFQPDAQIAIGGRNVGVDIRPVAKVA